MAKNLLIVESPAKAKTIEKILGKDFEVKSSFGHIRDLEKEGMGIDIENGFRPAYEVSDDKKKVVAELKSKAQKAEEVWLATDEDREGEAISWHLCEVLGLDPHTTKRIVFHEITKNAIKQAVANPRTVDMNLVNAQQARRVLDRLVGFEVSPVLWRKLSGKSLSAGRVQSVAVRLIVDREREINQFNTESHYKTEATFEALDINKRQVIFKAEGEKWKDNTTAREFLNQCIGATFKVEEVQVKPAKRTPAAPFTTSTLQQEAARKLGYSVSRTMRVAQTLYENGYITYMRTDSVNLSQTAIQNAEEVISKQYGNKYHQRRQYQTKNQNAQEAHEAIRPTDLNTTQISIADGQKLYELIWKRTIASQMADAQLEKTIVNIGISTNQHKLQASGEVIKFEGFLKVYLEGRDDDDEKENEGMLPPLQVGQQLPLVELKTIERFSRAAARYTEASLVKKLEELGIGRPSTYAPTISTVQQRNYVERRDKEGVERKYQVLTLSQNTIAEKTAIEITGAEKAKLFPTDLGTIVTDFLNEHFTQIMDYGFTAQIENEFDEVAQGEKAWNAMIGNFYKPFHKQVTDTMENAQYTSGERILGNDPESGRVVSARLGRFGPMIQIGTAEEADKPKFATIKQNQSIETITLQEALDLFKLPMTLGNYKDQEVVVGAGRFGPYVKWNENFISIPRAYNFDNLSQNDITEMIEKKVEKEANRYIQQWEDEKISIENGRWGPFIRMGKLMLKLGKNPAGEKYTADELATISLDEVKQMIKAQVPDAFDKKTTKKATTKKSTTKKTATKTTSAKKSVAKKK